MNQRKNNKCLLFIFHSQHTYCLISSGNIFRSCRSHMQWGEKIMLKTKRNYGNLNTIISYINNNRIMEVTAEYLLSKLVRARLKPRITIHGSFKHYTHYTYTIYVYCFSYCYLIIWMIISYQRYRNDLSGLIKTLR